MVRTSLIDSTLDISVGDGGRGVSFGGTICIVCQKVVENTWNYVHEECERCPECGSDFTVRRAKLRPVVQRCFNCLHRWEIE